MQNRKRVPERRSPGRPLADSASGAEALLRAAQAAFATDGYQAASLRKISKAAGVNVTLTSHHFGSKQGLWDAVIERIRLAVSPYLEELQALQEDQSVPIRIRLETALTRFVEVSCREPESGMLLARVSADGGGYLSSVTERLARPYREAFEPLLTEAMREKVIPEQPVRLLYYLLFHSIIMTISFRHVLDSDRETDFSNLRMLNEEMVASVLVLFGLKN